MKKLKLFLALSVMSLMLTACGTSNTTSKDAIKGSETESVENAETEAPKSALGKRSNPVPVGETFTFESYYFAEDSSKIESEVSITLSNPIRGEDAFNFMKESNEYNDPAPEGQEWLVFDFSLTLNKGNEDESCFVSPYFRVIDSSGSEIEQTIYAHFAAGEDFGDVKIFPGGNVSGKIGKLVPIDDDTLIEFSNWDASVFFSIQ